MIAKNFDEAFAQVKQLVADFQQGESHYPAPTYSESQARKDFIDKFWMALGWDVDHVEERNPYEQRVKVEHSQKEGARRKRADYAFLADNFRDVRFFVEAKKPALEIDNPTDYFQTIRYGWNGQTPLAVLTDFQQFRILDCRYKPDIDAALGRAVRKFHYTDYADAERFREIYHLFAREAVVEQMLAAKQQLAAAQTDRDKNFYEHKCTALDRQIDQLVYELYGLTDEEIAIVEGG